jgi:hypothetical protein
MAAAKKTTKKTARGRAQDRAKVAGGQKYELSYEAKKTGGSAPAVKKPLKRSVTSGRRLRRSWRAGSSVPSGARHQFGGHSGQVSPIESKTSLTSATAASGDNPAGGCCRAMSTA